MITNKKYFATLLLLTLVSSPLYAQVIINTQNTDVPNEWKLGLDGSGNYNNADLDANKAGALSAFTGGSPNDTFTAFLRPYSDFSQAGAVAAATGGTFGTYADGLTLSTIGRLAGGGFGVIGSTIDGETQAIFITFGNYSLAPTTEVEVSGFALGNFTANDRVDFFFWDSSANTVAQSLNLQSAAAAAFSVSDVQSGDILVIAGSAAGQNFRIDNVSFDLITVPEPSTFAFLGLSLAGICLLRRRK